MNAVRARSAALLACAALFCLPALARFGILPLPDAFGRSVAVVAASIQSGRVAGYTYRNHSGTCGYVYEAQVAESFKGDLEGTFMFASNLAMAPGSRHLLFLRRYASDFPADTHVFLEDPQDPDFGARVEQSKAACIAALPRLKSDYLHTAELVAATYRSGELATPGNWLGLPASLPTAALPGSRSVDWDALRAWLRQDTVGILDTSGWEARCDDACTARRLEVAATLMQQNLDLARSMPSAAAVLGTSQRDWNAYLQSSCRAIARQWQDSGLAESIALDCRLGLTVQRARELWLLRRMPGFVQPARDACEATCVTERLTELSGGLVRLVAEHRRNVASQPQVLAAFTAAQVAWEQAADSQCAAVAALDVAACRLRQVEERLREIDWRHRFAPDEVRARTDGR